MRTTLGIQSLSGLKRSNPRRRTGAAVFEHLGGAASSAYATYPFFFDEIETPKQSFEELAQEEPPLPADVIELARR